MTQYSGIFTLPQQAQALTSGKWATDPYFKNTTLLLHADGIPGGAQNNTFIDSSSNAFTITRNGNTTQGTFSPYMPNGYWSNYFDGSGDYLDTPTSQAALQFGTGDFTIEMWVYPTAVTFSGATFCTSERVGTIANALLLLCDNTSNGKLQLYMDGTNVFASSTNCTLVANAWQHIAISRSGSSVYAFINGVPINNIASNSSNISKGDWRFGYWYQSQHSYNGYISNTRLVKGTAVYTSNFTPSTAPLTAITNTSLLTCQSNRFLDNSTNAFTVTPAGNVAVQQFQPFMRPYQYSTSVIGGSGYFDGTGDYLKATGSTLSLSTGDFTAEAFVYYKANASSALLVNATDNITSNAGAAFSIETGSDGTLYAYLYYGSSYASINAGALPLNAWTHVALVRNGNVFSLYKNGVATSTTQSITLNTHTNLFIGGVYSNSASNLPFNGHICDSRIVKGTAVYTSNFTPPTAPLTAITNTQLLCNFTNAGIYDNAMQNNLETVGNAQVSTSVVKYGSGSMYFDGTGDYLSIPNGPQTDFGAGDFTIEGWIYPTTYAGGSTTIIGKYTSGGAANQPFFIALQSAGTITCGINGTYDITTTATAPLNAWTHVAWTRSGNTFTVWLNGVSSATLTQSVTFNNPAIATTVGAFGLLGVWYFNGYIDDLRITKGVARYTSNFQPPQVAFANQ